MPRGFKRLIFGISGAALWPMYLGVAAYAARQAPWPRSVAFPASMLLAMIALAALVVNASYWFFGSSGPAKTVFDLPADVGRQARRTTSVLIVGAMICLLPAWLIARGLIAPDGRPIAAPALCRIAILTYELVVLGSILWTRRRGSSLSRCLREPNARRGWVARHGRNLLLAAIAGIIVVIVLDARGYSYSARRLASGVGGSLAVVVFCRVAYHGLARTIDRHAWRWILLAMRLRGRGEDDCLGIPEDMSGRLHQLCSWIVMALGLVLCAWVWDVDLALFRFISGQTVWTVDKDVVTVGDLTRAAVVLAGCVAAWRHMSTFFAVAIFPRIPDDPGLRFAIVMLCRYSVLGVGLIVAFSSIHVGLEKISVVVAALGVGLGFGLQEIVSNFVCGVILLLERPIRVGDIVTVSGMNGKVDRINIRATTIINGDNQSIIMPNRAFITGDLVNWTLKDKIIKVTVKVKVARGSDPDRVAELLQQIAREEADVLRNPCPSATLEEFTDFALGFALCVMVPEPGLAGRVKHRLYTQIQRRFAEAGFEIPLPTQTLLVNSWEQFPSTVASIDTASVRFDQASETPPGPAAKARREIVEDAHRAVDE
jgi:small-conductance mechanosensitive channel